MAIAEAVGQWKNAQQIYEDINEWATAMRVEKPLMKAILDAADRKPADYMRQQGWVIIAFQNALYQLLHAKSLEEGVVDTVMCGGDTDSNAAICGALLGAVHGREALPKQWVEKVLNCRPMSGQANVRHPRPECFWPVDALHIARCLVVGGEVRDRG
jgi:ADP-ribosylglycohydrolase